MCACKYKRGGKTSLTGFQQVLSSKDFANGDVETVFLYYYCVSPTKFNDALSKLSHNGDTVRVNDRDDVKALAKIHKEGTDSKLFGTSIKTLLDNIVFTQDELTKSSCNLAFYNE